jgi:hypothetical protein
MNKRDETMRMVKEVERKIRNMKRQEALAWLLKRRSETMQEVESLQKRIDDLESLRAKQALN